jgi:predicted ATP-grasp superfamily ATP-dependent carboligase
MKGQEPNPPAIVVGLDCITGLQTARILAGHNIPVIGIAGDKNHFCCHTRVCQQILETDLNTADVVRCLEKLGPQLAQKGVLFPCTDNTVLLLSSYREQLEPWFHMALPKTQVVEELMDKMSFLSFAKEHGLPIPDTAFVHNRKEAEEAAECMSFPCVIKPSMKTTLWKSQNLPKAYIAANTKELLDFYDKNGQFANTFIVQEWIEGTDADLYSCNCYFDQNNNPQTTFVARKIRQWPPRTGTSSLGLEVREDVVLVTTLELFQKAGYWGLGYVEMKRDSRNGRFYIIEPNIGRPTGRSSIAEGGNVALLYTMYCDLLGRPLPPNRQQNYLGTKWIYWRHDFQSAFYYWRRKELTLGEWYRSWRGPKACAVFSWSDPTPFLVDMVRSSIFLLRKKSKKKTKTRQSVPPIQQEAQHKTI